MRSPELILARIREVDGTGTDWLGTERMDLVTALPIEHARPFLKDDFHDEWVASTAAGVKADAITYLAFAQGKALSHRGISAGRSTSHYRAWLWLLNLLPPEWDTCPYPQYGAPKLVLAAAALGSELTFAEDEDRSRFMRMAEGVECAPNCTEGCG